MNVIIKEVEALGVPRLRVKVPYNPRFVTLAHQIDGVWIYRAREWSFQPRHREAVERIIKEVFGEVLTPP